MRRSGNRIRVAVQLVNAQDGYHLWSERYDREMAELFDLQDEIAQAIAFALHVKLSGTAAPYKPGLPAYEALLKARHYFGTFRPDFLPRARECYEQAAALDPKFAQAHSEYGNYFLAMAMAGALPANQALPMIRSQAQKALELAPSLPEGHAMLALVAALLEYDWKKRRCAFACRWLAIPCRSLCASSTPWVTICRRAGRPKPFSSWISGLQEDPLNLLLRAPRAFCLAAAGRDEEAADGCREMLEFNPAMLEAHRLLAGYHALRGQLDDALAHSEKAYALAPSS